MHALKGGVLIGVWIRWKVINPLECSQVVPNPLIVSSKLSDYETRGVVVVQVPLMVINPWTESTQRSSGAEHKING